MASTQRDDSKVRGLVMQAERAMAAGQRDEAKRLLAQAKSAEPEHPLVLNAEAVQALHAGDVVGARRLLERAIAEDATNPGFWLNLATALIQLNLPQESVAALDKVLVLDPRHLLALFQKAALLQGQGKSRAAAELYKNALATIPPGAQLPEALRPAIQKAQTVIRENNAALENLLDGKLRELRGRYDKAQLARFEHSLDALLGKRRIFVSNPTFLAFPKLPAYEFYERDDFPWLKDIEAATSDIRAEFERVLIEDAAKLEPYIRYPEGVPLDQWAELNQSKRWSVFHLWREGKRVEQHAARCPRTVEAFERLPGNVDIAGVGPSCMFSILSPRTRIPPHTGVTNTRLVVHLPLVIPPGCGFRVGSETREWKEGEAWVFDDTIEHEAWNQSEVPRAILIFDTWNPDLTPAERDLLRVTVAAVQEYNHEQPLATGLN
jgi:aspartate beta-hydroxylase